jgi:large subunit ribosomal protein L29
MPVDLKELRQLSAPELAEKEKQLRQELFNLRFQLGTGRLENPMQLRKARRDLARLKTVLRQLELSQERASSEGKR